MTETAPTLRPWIDADVDWWVRLRHDWYPLLSPEQLRRMASGTIAPYQRRTVAVDGERRLGAMTLIRPPGEETSIGLVLVEPEARGRGVGRALFADLVAHHGAEQLDVSMPDTDPTSLAVARHWGYRVVSHSIQSSLDVSHAVASPVPEGIAVRVLHDADLETEGVELDPLLVASATHPEAVELGWSVRRSDLTALFPDMVWSVVEEAGVPVAVASADRQDRRSWLVIFTCVHPAHRGKGLGRLAKEHLHAAAAGEGARSLVTGNDERNVGIRALNAAMGYVVTGGEYRLSRPAGLR